MSDDHANPGAAPDAAPNLGQNPAAARGDSMLIAYDGSEEARRAIQWAGSLLSVRTAYILTAWEPLQRQAARTAGASGMMQPDWDSTVDDGDPAHEEAQRICREGVEVAASVGFTAEPYLVESETTIWSAIVDAARDLDALRQRSPAPAATPGCGVAVVVDRRRGAEERRPPCAHRPAAEVTHAE